MRPPRRGLFGSTAAGTPSTNQKHCWVAGASLHNFHSSTSKDALCARRAERQSARAWVRTLPLPLLLAFFGYGQHAYAQTLSRCIGTQTTTSCGLRVLPTPGTPEGWFFNINQIVAVAASDLTPPLSIYMDNRGLLGEPRASRCRVST